MSRFSFSLEPVPPFRLDLTAWAIRRRRENAMDVWDGETYSRVLTPGARPVLVEVTQSGKPDAPRLNVAASGIRAGSAARAGITAALRRLLGFDIDLAPFYRLASTHPRLNELARRFRGLKPPRFPLIWEGAVNGIACQQLSLAVGIILLNRLCAAFGPAYEGPDGPRHAFPRPEDLAPATPGRLRPLGYSGAKGRALIELARRIVTGDFDLEGLDSLDNETAIARLLELRGAGRWTAEYVLLRGMGRTDMFPGDDIGARKNLSRWLHPRTPLDYARTARMLSRWHPYGGLIYFHLLLNALEAAGEINA